MGRGANLTFIATLKKGWEEVQKLNFQFEEESATLTFLAFIIAKENETFPFETISTHQAPHTNAFYYVRGAMLDRSQVNYTGYLIIEKGAQMTDSYLAHHSLMLSKDAKVVSIPSLEIEADDVKAGHAATMGRVDEDLLFYLESRGIDKQAGTDMLIKGFMEADLQKIPSEEIRLALSEEIANSF